MIDKQKIQEAANNYIGHEPEIDEGCNVSARREAFKDGVDWFKGNIWHNATEQPIEFTPILVQWLNEGKIEYETDEHPQNFDWQKCFKENNVIKWCYLSDII